MGASLWEALATFLINWLPHWRQIELYQRITEAPVVSNRFPPTAAVDGLWAGTVPCRREDLIDLRVKVARRLPGMLTMPRSCGVRRHLAIV